MSAKGGLPSRELIVVTLYRLGTLLRLEDLLNLSQVVPLAIASRDPYVDVTFYICGSHRPWGSEIRAGTTVDGSGPFSLVLPYPGKRCVI